jgi:hypothetical protein
MEDKHISPKRFAWNFKRLLKVFLADLAEDAPDSIDLELANLISLKAGFVATRILELLGP